MTVVVVPAADGVISSDPVNPAVEAANGVSAGTKECSLCCFNAVQSSGYVIRLQN